MSYVPTIQNPVFTCSKCGKKVVQGGVSTGIPDYWVCKECRDKMKKFSLSFTFYKDGYADISGNCDFCKQTLVAMVTNQANLRVQQIKFSAAQRKRWLETLMTFPAAKIVQGKKLVQRVFGKPLCEVEAEVEVYWPAGEGGRPAEVYGEIESVLNSYGCSLETYKTDSDDHLGWIRRLVDSAPSEKDVKVMLRRDGDGLERMPDNLIFWDWKESRLEMIKDLNEAMEALNVPLKWKHGETDNP